MSKQGLRMVDMRHTLPNLKYLLTIMTTGKGELPARKKGMATGFANGHPMEDQDSLGKADLAEKSPDTNGRPPELPALSPERK